MTTRFTIITHVVPLRGAHRNRIGYMRGTWGDRCEAARKWGVDPRSQKIYVHGLRSGNAIEMRFGWLREATALEISAAELNGKVVTP